GEAAEQRGLDSPGIVDDDDPVRDPRQRRSVDEGAGGITAGHVEFAPATADDVFDEHARLRQPRDLAELREILQQLPAAVSGGRVSGQTRGGHSISLDRSCRRLPLRLPSADYSAS